MAAGGASLPLSASDLVVLGAAAASSAVIVASALRRAGRGALVVSANIENAEVYVDGKHVGKTPVELEVRPGDHLVEVKAEGFEAFTTKVKVKRGGRAEVHAVLEPLVRCDVLGFELSRDLAHVNEMLEARVRVASRSRVSAEVFLKPVLRAEGGEPIHLREVELGMLKPLETTTMIARIHIPEWIKPGVYRISGVVVVQPPGSSKTFESGSAEAELVILESPSSVVSRVLGKSVVPERRVKRKLKKELRKTVVVDDRYRVVGVIGEGAFSVTLMAYDEAGVTYALKVPKSVEVLMALDRGELLSEETVVVPKEFIREAEVLKRVSEKQHPHVVKFYGHTKSIPGIVLEYCEGGSLKDLLEEVGVLEPSRALTIAIQVADALVAAYSAGLRAHRDLKPSNILFTRDGVARLTDFNISRIMGSVSRGMSIAGTMGYAAPEQFDYSLGEVSDRSDVYSLALMVYEMLTGSNPLATLAERESSYTAACSKLRIGGVELGDDPPRKRASRMLYDVMKCSLSLKPERRPSMKEFRDTLVDVLQLLEL